MPSKRKEVNAGAGNDQPKLLKLQEVTQNSLDKKEAEHGSATNSILQNVFVKFVTAVVFRGKTEISLKLPEVTFHEATGRIGFYDPFMKGMVYVWPSNIQFLRFNAQEDN